MAYTISGLALRGSKLRDRSPLALLSRPFLTKGGCGLLKAVYSRQRACPSKGLESWTDRSLIYILVERYTQVVAESSQGSNPT